MLKLQFLQVLSSLAVLILSDLQEDNARSFIALANNEVSANNYKAAIASWNYETNITNSNLKMLLTAEDQLASSLKRVGNEVSKYNWTQFADSMLKRQFQYYSKLGIYALPNDKLEIYNKLVNGMRATYSTAKICDFHDKQQCNLLIEPDVVNVFKKSANPDELKYSWLEVRRQIGPANVKNFEKYVKLSNEAAVLNNCTNMGECWVGDYEDVRFRANVERLWLQVQPFYMQMHAYVRGKLRQRYGERSATAKGPIPAHLLGDIWAQEWGNVAEATLPYPNRPKLNIDRALKEKDYDVLKIFKTAESFFKSIHLNGMTKAFWKNSMFMKPAGRDVVCHPSAWDLGDGVDFRIKTCAEVSGYYFDTVHHEMGHIEYFMAYKQQPFPFRNGANKGFHEAIGDLVGLSAGSRKHQKRLGLVHAKNYEPQDVINDLYRLALNKVMFLPFAYIMDRWRWGVFAGQIHKDDYNCKWWELTERFQGVEPPLSRSKDDFDPAAKFHILDGDEYIRYFVSNIIQFQFHESLCRIAGQYDPENVDKPLYNCDIYKSGAAGRVLKDMLRLGSSQPWPEAMEVITKQREMDANSMLEYFRPLHEWIQNENKRAGNYVGWEKSKKGFGCDPSLGSALLNPSLHHFALMLIVIKTIQ